MPRFCCCVLSPNFFLLNYNVNYRARAVAKVTNFIAIMWVITGTIA